MTPARLLVAAAALSTVLATALAAAPTPVRTPADAPPATGLDRSAADPAVRAQDDFFRNQNGLWLARTEIPADKARIGVLTQVYDRTQDQLLALIEDAAKDTSDPRARQIGDLYASFMDEPTIEARGLKPLAAELAAIDALDTPKQLGAVFAHLDAIGVAAPIGQYIDQDAREATRYVPILEQNGLGLPDRDYYLQQDDARFRKTRDDYLVYVARLLTLAGAPAGDAAATARAVLALETQMAQVMTSRVDDRDPVATYHRVALADLPKTAAGFDWPGFLATSGVQGRTPDVIVRQPGYLAGLDSLLATVPLATWKAYLKTRLLSDFAPYLSKPFVDARFAFVGGSLSGMTENRPRWKRGVQAVQSMLGEGLGRLYVARYFPPANKAHMEALVGNLLAAYRERIDALDWMGPATKKEAQAKLAAFASKIGYPATWIDYASLKIVRDDLAGNVLRANAFETARHLAKLGKPVDRAEWHMTPQTVNAYYNQTLNEIVFPAAILQPPMFDAGADDAVNYGAIGAVIGHEISHGFDDKGSQYDGSGNLRDWWTAADRTRFQDKTAALVAQYAAFVPVPGYHLNGELTLGENIADNSGLAMAYRAYRRSLGGRPAPVIDGLTGDQRFFMGYAQAWRGKIREAALLSQIKSDPHSPEESRVNGTVRNQDAFYPAFDVKPGDKMYLPPAERVSIW